MSALLLPGDFSAMHFDMEVIMEKYEKPEMEIMEFDEKEVETLTEPTLSGGDLNPKSSQLFNIKKPY